jgi:DNA-binding NarL/FixJ family response regulator
MNRNKDIGPRVVCVTDNSAVLLASQTVLRGSYQVIPVRHDARQHGVTSIVRHLDRQRTVGVIVDSGLPHDPVLLAERAQAIHPTLGLIFVCDDLNIFKVLRCLKAGYRGYLYVRDPLDIHLKAAVDHTRRAERYLSPTIRGLYARYTSYKGLFTNLTPVLMETFKLMGEGLDAQDMMARTGLRSQVVYRRQYRLRQHFGVASNRELEAIIREMFAEPEERASV